MTNKLFKIKAVSLFIFLTIISYSGASYSTSKPMLHVSHYSFGEITINDKVYTKDIAIWPIGEIHDGPEDMHFLSTDDFEKLFKSNLKKLVIGTGDEGKVEMDISRKLEKSLTDNGIELILMDTHDLVKFLNEATERDYLVLVHLNC